MPVGRPTQYREEYCEMLIEHMSKGLSYESFAGLIGVGRSTIYDWEKSQPAFSDAKSVGHAKMTLNLEEIGLKGMMGKLKGFNASTFIFTMKNKCGWSDKNEVEQNSNVKVTLAYSDEE